MFICSAGTRPARHDEENANPKQCEQVSETSHWFEKKNCKKNWGQSRLYIESEEQD